MQVALLVPEQEWRQLLADVQRLKEFEAATPQTPPPPPDRLLNVRQAAELLTISPAGLRKARRVGHLTGVCRDLLPFTRPLESGASGVLKLDASGGSHSLIGR